MKQFIAVLALFVCGQSFAVSFDCTKFNTGVYKIICESPELSKLDDELTNQYNNFNNFFKELGNDKERETFRSFVKEMLNRRNACTTEACLLRWYKESLQAYEDIKSGAEGLILQDSQTNQFAQNRREPVKPSYQSAQVPDWAVIDGTPLTMDKESNTGAFISYSKAGGINFFILPFWANHDVCKKWQGGVQVMESLHFNGVLVQMGQGCDSDLMYLMPLTYKGTNYIISQFRTRSSVVVTDSRGRDLFKFGAIGFTKALQQFIDNSGRTGGL